MVEPGTLVPPCLRIETFGERAVFCDKAPADQIEGDNTGIASS